MNLGEQEEETGEIGQATNRFFDPLVYTQIITLSQNH
jgi:hypothetical protein